MKKIFLSFFTCVFSLLCAAQANEASLHYRLVVGTYTSGASKGIYLFDFNGLTGETTLTDSVITVNPSFMAISPDEKYIFAVQESGKDAGSGKVISFSLNDKQPSLIKINEMPSGGDDPCYVATDKTGNWLAVANYSSGNFSLFTVDQNSGKIGPAKYTIADHGKGKDALRQEKPHLHCATFSPDNKFLLTADLGTDSIISYNFNDATGELKLLHATGVEPGSGPRHIIFDAQGKFVYLTEELSGTVTVFAWQDGELIKKQIISALPEMFTGKISGADLHLSPDGRFLYSSNRGSSNSITLFSVGTNGLLKVSGHQQSMGRTPRNFTIDPSGKFLLIANQDSNNIVIFIRDTKSGKLTDTGKRILIGNPVCLKWIK